MKRRCKLSFYFNLALKWEYEGQVETGSCQSERRRDILQDSDASREKPRAGNTLLLITDLII
jgi:hypothetical protein